MIFSSDDLPAPLRPIRPSRSPASSDERRRRRAGRRGRRRGARRKARERPWAEDGSRRLAQASAASRASMKVFADVEAALLGDLLEAGRAGDVDLGQAVADDVEPDQQQAALAPASGRCARRSRGRAPRSAAPRPCRRPPGCRGSRCPAGCAPARTAPACRRSPGCACRPATISGTVALHHHGVGAALVQRLDDRAEVQAVGADAEDARAAHAVERLQDDVAVLGVEALAAPSASRVTSVGAMNCGNSRIASFSGWSRSAAGRLKTRAPSRSACSSRWVA